MLVAEFEDLIARRGADGSAASSPNRSRLRRDRHSPKGYLKRMWEVCQRHDILFIADGVVTAFGRLGRWFASKDEFDVVPDMITSAKGLTSGYVPLGALIFSDRMWNTMAEERAPLVLDQVHLFRATRSPAATA